jgi:signal transduction histidine kinase
METLSISLPAQAQVTGGYMEDVKLRSDKLMNYFLFVFFLGGIGLAGFYDTWNVALGIGGLSLIAYYSAKYALPDSTLYQYVLGAVFGIFMAQYIYQMHGLFEMHFIAFIASAILITYQNWKLQIPLTIVVVGHHALFGYLQYSGYDKIYFTQLDYMSLQTFIIHAFLAAFIFAVCGLWAYNFRKYTELYIQQNYEISKLEQEQAKQQVLKEMNEMLEQKVHERTIELETVNKELEGFNYSVSHDLRAPLRVIQGFGKMILKTASERLNTSEQDNLRDMIKNAKHMGNLVDDLLDFSRLGRAQLTKNKVNMNAIVQDVIEEVKAANPETNVQIDVSEMQATSCDLTLIKQVWTNLISNAVKYSRKKEHPLVQIGSTGLNGSQVFFIKDNGAGFNMEHSDKLFGVFQRLHKVSEYEGTGVGLALVHRIVTKHGGKIWAEGTPNEGATFYFTV